MSNLKQFTSKIENTSSGEIVSSLEYDEQFYTDKSFLKCDGSVVLQNAYPYLYEKIGNFFDNLDAPISVGTSNTSNSINALIYGNNTFVYAGGGGVLATSPNGTTWTISPSAPLTPTYVGGKAAERLGSTLTASLSLTDLTGGASAAPQEGDLVIIAVATGSSAQRSQAVTGFAGYTQIASLYSNDTEDTNLWVGYKIMGPTPDTTVTIPASGSIDDAQTVAIQVWRNVIFDVVVTTTGIDTVLADPPSITTTTGNNVVLVIGAGGHSDGTQTYAASYADNFLTIGSDDINDSTIGFGSVNRPTAGAYDPAAFTFSGSDLGQFSFAAVTIALQPSTNINALTYGNNTFVYAGDGGVLATSPDGTTWTTRTSGTANNINALTYGDETFVYAGDGGVLATSPDGSTWTTRTSGTANNINALTYANNIFVYAGDGGVLATSPDGASWTQRTSGTVNNINALTYGNNTFVYAGDAGALATSPNGSTWTQKNIRPTFVGSRTVERLGSTSTESASLTTLTGGTNTAPQAGDLVVIAVATGSNVSSSQAVTGYTQIASLYSNDINDTNLWVGYKTMGLTPDTTVTIPASGSTNDAQTVAIQVWRNVEYVTRTTATGVDTVLADPPSITTTTDNSIVLVIGAGAYSVLTVGIVGTYTASYSEHFRTIGSSDTFDSTIGFGSVYRPTAGAYDPPAFTFSRVDSLDNSFAAVTVALRSSTNINALTYVNSNLIRVGSNGMVEISSDTVTWSAKSSGTSNTINTLTYDSGTFIIGGDLGYLSLYSPYTYDFNTEFLLPTSNSYFDLYIKS
jgi:hypothetical protein